MISRSSNTAAGRTANSKAGSSAALTAFGSRWLAESVRLWEAAGANLDDSAAVEAARAAPGDAEQRIRLRAERLGATHGLATRLRDWRRHAGWLLFALLAVAVAGGFGTALAVLDDGSRPVNVVWALLGLLGLPTLMLALWLASFWLDAGGDSGALGRFWLWLSQRRWQGPDPTPIVRGLYALLAPAGLLRWALGAVSHWLWSAALLGACGGLLLSLSAIEFEFVWETTILPAGAFVRAVEIIGWLPAQFGFGVPDPDLVRASGGTALEEAAARRLWSGWLVGALVVHGLLPRLLLAAFCQLRFALGRSRLRLDLWQPYYAVLAARLAPASERIGVTDAERAGAPVLKIAAPHLVESRAGLLIGLELTDDPPDWPNPPPPGVTGIERIDSREQRQHVLTRLAADPPARLLLACDPRLSPDRGSLALIVALSHQAGACRLWLPAVAADPARRGHWRQALTGIGLAPEHVYDSTAEALGWLAGEDPGS